MSVVAKYSSPHLPPCDKKINAVLEMNALVLSRYSKYSVSALRRAIEGYEQFLASPQSERDEVLGFLVLPLMHKSPAPPMYNTVPYQQSGAFWNSRKSSSKLRDEAEARDSSIAAEKAVDEYGSKLVIEFEQNNHKIPSRWTPIDAGVFARYIGKAKDYYQKSDVLNTPAVKAGGASTNEAVPSAYVFMARLPDGTILEDRSVRINSHKALGLPADSEERTLQNAQDCLQRHYESVLSYTKNKEASTPAADAMKPSGGRFAGFAQDLFNRIKAPEDPYLNKPGPNFTQVRELEDKLVQAYAGGTREDFEQWCSTQPVDELYTVNEWMRHLIALYYSMNLSKYETRYTTEQLARYIDSANHHIYKPQR